MLMMTPGPIAVDHRVVAALNQPATTHHAPAFSAVLEDVLEMLRPIFGTASHVTLLPGSGRLGLESAVVSVVERGEPTVHLVNGTFAGWSVDIARRAGAEATVVEGPWDGPANLDAVREAIAKVRPKLVTIVHSETSTGVLHPLEDVSRLAHEHGALFMVDVISSVGCVPFKMDEVGADLAVCTSNKGLGSLIGLSLVGVSPRAYAVMDARKTVCQSYSLDLKRWKDSFFGKPFPRAFPVVPSTHMVYALQVACRQALAEGLEPRWDRHARYAAAVRKAVQAAGLALWPQEGMAGNAVTAVRVPVGLQEADILKGLEAKGVLIAGSMPGPIKGKLFRLSHQGVQASEEMLIPTLAALERTLRELGFAVEPGVMITAFEAALGH
ncbi:MAG: alanine--glyoxylate aminotransferase family protein [Chloroflexi bacterium]|nr:alanine--glyoxylate aminotransferase family protein [Chloroflexota bacterium]